jgi:hypothetical protein
MYLPGPAEECRRAIGGTRQIIGKDEYAGQ